ncbi:hypothetical protein B0H11DRAFT_2194907 [Mycena galericulata]|nr:hypothetical protein B0H11DRAFT_2194907 [Mycena galericulata]
MARYPARTLVVKMLPTANTHARPSRVLIHNAASAIGPFKLTPDGLESQIATDHIGPFLLTKLLAPKLLASRSTSETYTPRVVFVSSGGHALGSGVDLASMKAPDAEEYENWNGYYRAKSANILTALEVSKRSGGKINAYSLNPGSFLGPDKLPNTDKFQWKTLPQGAATIVAAAFDPRVNEQPGPYLVDSTVANEAVSAHSSDPYKCMAHTNVFMDRKTFELNCYRTCTSRPLQAADAIGDIRPIGLSRNPASEKVVTITQGGPKIRDCHMG